MKATQNQENKTQDRMPLISCIMPTANRAQYVAGAVRQFLTQDYPEKELVIVFNKDTDLPPHWALFPSLYLPPNIRLVRTGACIIGAKRNEACRHAQGAIIAQWDDDDIYNTNRLTVQAAPILRGEADITGFDNVIFYEAPTGNSWLPTQILHSEIFVGGVHGGSLMYNRLVWDAITYYPNQSLGEDAVFLRKALKKGIRLLPVDGFNSYVYVRHTSNSWKFEKDNFRRYDGWRETQLPAWALPYGELYTTIALQHRQLQQNTKQPFAMTR